MPDENESVMFFEPGARASSRQPTTSHQSSDIKYTRILKSSLNITFPSTSGWADCCLSVQAVTDLQHTGALSMSSVQSFADLIAGFVDPGIE